jgi:hypothetical protein
MRSLLVQLQQFQTNLLKTQRAKRSFTAGGLKILRLKHRLERRRGVENSHLGRQAQPTKSGLAAQAFASWR